MPTASVRSRGVACGHAHRMRSPCRARGGRGATAPCRESRTASPLNDKPNPQRRGDSKTVKCERGEAVTGQIS